MLHCVVTSEGAQDEYVDWKTYSSGSIDGLAFSWAMGAIRHFQLARSRSCVR
jgi:hypothetical protein